MKKKEIELLAREARKIALTNRRFISEMLSCDKDDISADTIASKIETGSTFLGSLLLNGKINKGIAEHEKVFHVGKEDRYALPLNINDDVAAHERNYHESIHDGELSYKKLNIQENSNSYKHDDTQKLFQWLYHEVIKPQQQRISVLEDKLFRMVKEPIQESTVCKCWECKSKDYGDSE